jgi:hypothetical protein
MLVPIRVPKGWEKAAPQSNSALRDEGSYIPVATMGIVTIVVTRDDYLSQYRGQPQREFHGRPPSTGATFIAPAPFRA